MRNQVLAAAAAACLLSGATAASATDFSFTGSFVGDDEIQFFNFSVGAESTVVLRTYSYAGGVNAAGETIARGGFDPILSVYDGAGTLLLYNDDDQTGTVPVDTTGNRYDTFLSLLLGPGAYSVAVTQFDNFGPSQLPGQFDYEGAGQFRNGFVDAGGDRRDGHWAFDVLNVAEATQVGGVPEPGTWALMIAGFGGAGLMLRRRRTADATA